MGYTAWIHIFPWNVWTFYQCFNIHLVYASLQLFTKFVNKSLIGANLSNSFLSSLLSKSLNRRHLSKKRKRWCDIVSQNNLMPLPFRSHNSSTLVYPMTFRTSCQIINPSNALISIKSDFFLRNFLFYSFRWRFQFSFSYF